MIEVKNLYKGYGDRFAISNINLRVEAGKIHGLIGENGCGKTTLIKCLTGIYRPGSGEVLIDGQNVYDNPIVKARMGYVADSSHYFTTYTLRKLITFYNSIYPHFNFDKFKEINELFKVDINKKMKQMSKGQQMRASFLLNISIEPDILVLDEPTSGLDVIAKKELLDILEKEAREREMTVIISSHHLTELEKLCDTMTMMQDGEVKYDDDIASLKQKFKKYQVMFSSDVGYELNHFTGLIDAKKSGSMYTLILDTQATNPIEVFGRMGATLVEEIEMSIEEVFLEAGNRGTIDV